MHNSSWQVLPRRALVRYLGAFSALLSALFLGLTSGTVHALNYEAQTPRFRTYPARWANTKALLDGYPTMQAACEAAVAASHTVDWTTTFEEVRVYTDRELYWGETDFRTLPDGTRVKTPPVALCSMSTVYMGDSYHDSQPIYGPPNTCPANSNYLQNIYIDGPCKCKPGFVQPGLYYRPDNVCVPPAFEIEGSDAKSCPADGALNGNPIVGFTGEKVQYETDLADDGPAGLTFRRSYGSIAAADETIRPASALTSLGRGWRHDHAATLIVSGDRASFTGTRGERREFTRSSSAAPWVVDVSVDSLSASGAEWTYQRASDDMTLRFDAAGRMVSQTTRNGWVTRYVYSAQGQLASIANPFGSVLTLAYDAAARLASVTTADGRRVAYAYDVDGRLASVTYPDGKQRSYVYDAAGNLIKAKDALGLERTYAYDAARRVVAATEPNGAVTTYSWDARDRLLSRVTGALQPTVYGYNPTGTLASLSLPNGVTFSFSYDPAQRLIGWSNNRGESGSYTLDAMGNRISEQVKNGTGAIAWLAAKSVNSLNRVASRTEGYNQSETFGYDANGELTSRTNGVNESTRYGLDGLRRIASITDAANATASLSYNPLDGIVQAKDFKGVATGYARDAQGNATAETSADIGTRKTEYDALGLPSKIVDAMGQATTITRDAIGRPTALTFADGKVTTLAYDLTPNSRGYLSRIVDRSGTTDYTRDNLGRVVGKRQSLASGLVQEVGYGYAANGLLASISYPGGGLLTLGYDNTGRLIALAWNGTPIVGNVMWNPMGQPTSWKWTSGATASNTAIRSYDTAGRLKLTEFSSYVHDAAGRIISLSQQLHRPGDTNPTHTTTALGNVVSNVHYDSVGRITGFDSPGNETGFSYDANGNRTASTKALNGLVTNRGYTVEAQSNKLTGFNQTIGSTNAKVVYGYNANGDLTSDGLRTFNYDAEGRLSGVTTGATDVSPTTRYAHNALGQRVFKTEPVYPPVQGDENDAGFWQSLVAFFTKLWSPANTNAEKLGFAFMYDEDGNLISETGTGGPNSTGSTQYIYLPTANGSMPIAAVINGVIYRVSSDHLNTPRRVSNSQGQVVWQWAYSAFGDSKPTLASSRSANSESNPDLGTTGIAPIVFNKGYDGQYYDKESGLFYNYFRSYKPDFGYTQNDPLGLAGGMNRKTPSENNLLRFTDPFGLQVKGVRNPLSLLEGGVGGGGNGGGGGLTLGMIGAGAGAWIGTNITGPMLAKPPQDARDPFGAKAPGKPSEAEGFIDPKRGEDWVRNPNGRGSGWKAADGGVWCPTGPDSGSTGDAHGGPHWDVEYPGGKYDNIYPGGRRR